MRLWAPVCCGTCLVSTPAYVQCACVSVCVSAWRLIEGKEEGRRSEQGGVCECAYLSLLKKSEGMLKLCVRK